MKTVRILINLFFILAVVTACDKLELDDPDFSVNWEKMPDGKTVKFTIEGDAEFFTIYTGDEGHNYNGSFDNVMTEEFYNYCEQNAQPTGDSIFISEVYFVNFSDGNDNSYFTEGFYDLYGLPSLKPTSENDTDLFIRYPIDPDIAGYNIIWEELDTVYKVDSLPLGEDLFQLDTVGYDIIRVDSLIESKGYFYMEVDISQASSKIKNVKIPYDIGFPIDNILKEFTYTYPDSAVYDVVVIGTSTGQREYTGKGFKEERLYLGSDYPMSYKKEVFQVNLE